MSGVVIEPFGRTRAGRDVHRATLVNDAGLRVRILSYGGVIQSLEVPDKFGRSADVVLGFPGLLRYETESTYFGAIIGRYASRIRDARFELDGVTHHLAANDENGSLHGGPTGFHCQVWDMTTLPAPALGVRLHLSSPHGDNGFPGDLEVDVDYEVALDDNILETRFTGTTTRATVVNLTGHSYFNLAGEGSGTILDHELLVDADEYLPVGAGLVPTGEFASVGGTPLDFRQSRRLGDGIREGHPQLALAWGYDHNFVLRPASGLRRAARLVEPASGRTLDVRTTEPGLDVYTGNFLNGTLTGKAGRLYRQGDGIALEPEHFTDSPNRSEFPSTVLRPGEVYRSRMEYEFGVSD